MVKTDTILSDFLSFIFKGTEVTVPTILSYGKNIHKSIFTSMRKF